MLVEKNRNCLLIFCPIQLYRGTAVQGGGKKKSNDFDEAHDIMSKIFANASTEVPPKHQKPNQFSGPGKLIFKT